MECSQLHPLMICVGAKVAPTTSNFSSSESTVRDTEAICYESKRQIANGCHSEMRHV